MIAVVERARCRFVLRAIVDARMGSEFIVEDRAFAPARLPDQGEAKPIEE